MDNRVTWLVQLANWEQARLNAQEQANHAAKEGQKYLTKLLDSGMEMGDILEVLEDNLKCLEDEDGES